MTPQQRAIRNYRKRLTQQGLARFEVLGLESDRELIRMLAKRLAEDPESPRLRATVSQTLSGEGRKRGGVLEALRNSPLVGAKLNLNRSRETGRDVDL
jgi:hypothetical protein